MRFTWLFIIAELLFLDVHAQKIVPGEWEAQESIWVPFLSQSVRSSEDSITVQLIKKLSEHMNTVIVVEDDSVINRGKSLFARFNVDTSKIRLVKISPINMWLRDIGPVFFYSGENADMLSICNFKFTSYRNIPYEEVTDHTQLLDASGRKIGDLEGIQVHESELVLEGGAFEVNGKGCIILVDSLVLKRNQSFSKEQIENELAVKLGIKSFIWLRQGLAQDPCVRRRCNRQPPARPARNAAPGGYLAWSS